MTASARDARLLQTARRILEDAGRPLNVRRILRTGEQDDRFEGEPSLEDLRAALVAGVAEGVVVEARRGIFTVSDGSGPAPSKPAAAGGPAEAKPEKAPEAKPEQDDDKPRRRRRRREEPAPTSSETPRSLDEAAELSASASDRDALKGKLWERLRRKASQVTDQPVSEASAAETVEESDDEGDDRPREGRRRRRQRDSGERSGRSGRSGDTPRRRRGSKADEEPPKAAAEPRKVAEADAPEASDGDDDPRARLKARLRRTRPSKAAASTPAATEPTPAESSPAEPAPAAEGTRALLKNRLAARIARDEASEAKPEAKKPEAKDAPRSRRRRRGGRSEGAAPTASESRRSSDSADVKSAVKARLAARLGQSADVEEAPAPETPAAREPETTPTRKGDPRARLKARLSARHGASDDAVEAPAHAAAAADAPSGKADLRSALKARLAARAGEPAAEVTAAPAKKPEKTEPGKMEEAPTQAPSTPLRRGGSLDPRAALKAKLAARGGSPRPAPVEPAAAPTPEAEASEAPTGGPRAALKAKLATRRGSEPAAPKADPLEVPLAESRRPYREKRTAQVEPESERRAPTLAEVGPTSTLVSAALAALRGHGSPMSMSALAEQVDATAESGAVGLRAALRADNVHRERAGLRPQFVAHYGGDVGLTEWGLSARYRALEKQIHEALAEQQELVRRDLLARVGDLTDAGFEQVMVMLLEQLGHHGVKVVHRQTGTVALTVSRPLGGGNSEAIAVVARRSWGPIKDGTIRRLRDSLANFGADSGLVVTVGTFAASARAEARQDGLAHVRLIDGAGLAGLLFEHGIGLSSHQPVMRHLDVAFFESLEE